MDKIKTIYADYKDIIDYFGEERIEKRIRYFIDSIEDFFDQIGANKRLIINDSILTYCVMDYFTDIYRLKVFHHIERANDIKRVAYESKWLLKRKPIQILSALDEGNKLVYANEKYVLTYIAHELFRPLEDTDISKNGYINSAFLDSLYYHLKYRNTDAQTLELMILAFKAGSQC